MTSQLNSTEDELNDCFHNSHKLELDQNKNLRQWSEQRKELNEKIEAARDQIGLASSSHSLIMWHRKGYVTYRMSHTVCHMIRYVACGMFRFEAFEKVKCQQEKKNNRLKGVFFDACDARLAKAG